MYIGDKKIKETRETKEKTPGGFDILEVEYENGDVEWFSKLLYDRIITEQSCDASTLRDKRIFPMVEVILGILRDWGIKIGELPYLSALLNKSLDYNTSQALNELWSQFIPRPNSPDEVSLIAVDRVLRSKKLTLHDLLNGKK